MFKFELGQTVCHMVGRRVGSSEIWTRMCTENLHDDWACTDVQKDTWQHFGPTGIRYVTCHGVFKEEEIFATKEELLESL